MTQLTHEQQGYLAGASRPSDSLRGRVSDFVELSKLGITRLVVITAFVGFVAALQGSGGAWNYVALIAALFGTAMTCIGAGTLNQVLEIEHDARMKRTANRPLPSGRIGTGEAVLYGLATTVVGTVALAIWATPLAAVLALATVVSYVWMYTPLKRTTPWALVVGAAPGAMPPVIGAAAATGEVGLEAALLFLIMFVWQAPHFLAIAYLHREDYRRAGFPMLPVVEPDGESTFRQIVLTSVALLPIGLLPTVAGLTGVVYAIAALAAGLLMLGAGLVLIRRKTRRDARILFLTSLVYLPVVMIALPLDRT